MPRGGHRGGIYPISGLAWGPGQRYLKRGLYRHQRTDIFVPRWGFRRDNFNPSPFPDGGTKRWEPESSKAWPLLGVAHHVKMYAKNEERYLQPVFSGFGRPEVRAPGGPDNSMQKTQMLPFHFVKTAKKVEKEGNNNNDNYVSLVRLPFLERGRIRRLWDVILEADTWRSPASSRTSLNDGLFPVVDERAAVVRELPLAECLYTRSNHRLNSRRHPIWIHQKYQKNKSKVPYLHRRRLAREKMHADTMGALRA